MTIRLLYHDLHDLRATSPFDEALVAIARGDNLRVACPYFTVSYLERLTGLTAAWKVITDVEEWLLSLSQLQRQRAFKFMAQHPESIRHFARLHAKVVIGTKTALLGSANLTEAGITERTELSITIEEESTLKELARWFDEIWEQAAELPLDRIPAYLKNLPEREQATLKFLGKLFPSSVAASHPLVKLPEPQLPAPSPPPPLAVSTSSQSQFSRAPSPGTQYEIIDAILAAYPYSRDGKWLSAKRQIELLRVAYNAKLPDGRNAFPAMHGGADRGNAIRFWDGKDRTNRMKQHVTHGHAVKADGQNLYMLANGVTPAKMGVSQAVVDALATHNVIPWYNVNATNHVAPEV